MSHIVIDARIINSTTGRYVERLIHYLELIDKTNNYSILVRKKDLNFYQPSNRNFKIIEADFDDYSIQEQLGLKKLLDNLSPDLVHFCMPQQPILYKGKHITTFHDLSLLKTWNSDKNWFIYHFKQLVGKFVFRYVAKSSDHIIAISEYTKKDLIEFSAVDKNKITVTLESADTITGRVKSYNQPFKRYIMYVGGQSDYKNIKRLGDAHQKLLKTNPDLGLLLVGSINDSAKNNKLYFEKNNYKNILFTGFLPDDQLAYLYKNTKAYVFPSLMEGFGLPPLEAMSYGAPVVSSNYSCLPEINGNAAEYFDPLDIDGMAKSIDLVINNRSKSDDLIKKGYKQIKKYSWDKMARQSHEIYMNVLSEK